MKNRISRNLHFDIDIDTNLSLLVGHNGHKSIQDIYSKAAKAYYEQNKFLIERIKANKE